MIENKSEKNIPILFECKEDCCGCSACYAICPTKSIKMFEDIEGFQYPMINSDTCIQCSMCINVCPIKDK